MASKSEYSGRCHVAGEDVKLCRAGIDDLPDEILVTIFSHVSFSDLLDVVQKVCHRWRRLSQEMELWADKDYHIGIPSHCNSKNCKGSVTELEAIQIFQNAPNLCKVCIWHDVSPCLFRTLSEKCRRLKELRLRSTQKPSYSMLKNLVEKCSSLQMMRISDNLLRSEEFSETVSRLRNLRVMRLDHDCTEGTSASQPCVLLRPLADGCPQLAEMDFGRSFANIDKLRYFLNAKSNTLKSIRIKWTMGGTRSISPLLTVCANSLERVQLYETHLDHTAVTETFTALGSLKNLQELMITLPDQLLPGTAALAFKNGGLPKLRVLHLHNGCKLDDDAVIAISHGCPALRELSIKYAENLSDTAFSQIYHLEHLEILDLSCCRGLGEALFPSLVGLPRLNKLRFENMDFVKLQPGLSSILELSGLHCLIFDYCRVTGVPFDKFPGKLVNLRELGVEGCRGDPKAVDGLTEQIPNLKVHGVVQAVESALCITSDESDVEFAEENAVPENAYDTMDDHSESDRGSDGDISNSSDRM
ncbi:SCF E3 ubiquitin ligase complex F-box protein grrA-like isoform X2 [Schistocerca americana]|uniref:SCF E3 ubiquitin ligase complex F-box protein grrA-like isoform X2 n=1 Tax=Schistocerca americana TaxID=7009 RepID=UPI001F502ACE|nr:SCF E3 ubiquitin ligase complex F-box protein grrA-like isoform X2 [Schistocerca americana]